MQDRACMDLSQLIILDVHPLQLMIIFSRNISKANDIILCLQIFQNEVNVKLDNNWKNFMRISFQETVLKCYVLSNVTSFGNPFPDKNFVSEILSHKQLFSSPV